MWTWVFWQINPASGQGETWIQDIQMAKSVFWPLCHTASCVEIDFFPSLLYLLPRKNLATSLTLTSHDLLSVNIFL